MKKLSFVDKIKLSFRLGYKWFELSDYVVPAINEKLRDLALQTNGVAIKAKYNRFGTLSYVIYSDNLSVCPLEPQVLRHFVDYSCNKFFPFGKNSGEYLFSENGSFGVYDSFGNIHSIKQSVVREFIDMIETKYYFDFDSDIKNLQSISELCERFGIDIMKLK